jgi:hypothetical protein
MSDFEVWEENVMKAMKRLGRSNVGDKAPLLTCGLAYEKGWSPERTAMALLALNIPDYEELIAANIMAFGDQDKLYRKH